MHMCCICSSGLGADPRTCTDPQKAVIFCAVPGHRGRAHSNVPSGHVVHAASLSSSVLSICCIVEQVLKARIKSYVPNFSKAFEHVCIHTGGRGVIDEIEKQLRLPIEKIEPSRHTLSRYGNISSSSIWCALTWCHIYVQAKSLISKRLT